MLRRLCSGLRLYTEELDHTIEYLFIHLHHSVITWWDVFPRRGRHVASSTEEGAKRPHTQISTVMPGSSSLHEFKQLHRDLKTASELGVGSASFTIPMQHQRPLRR